jgi:hypothetical protein
MVLLGYITSQVDVLVRCSRSSTVNRRGHRPPERRQRVFKNPKRLYFRLCPLWAQPDPQHLVCRAGGTIENISALDTICTCTPYRKGQRMHRSRVTTYHAMQHTATLHHVQTRESGLSGPW